MDKALVLLDLREVRIDRSEMLEGLPVEFLGNRRVPRAVGVGERVAPGRGRGPDAVQLRLVQSGRIADFVQAGRPVELPVQQCHDMAGCRRASGCRRRAHGPAGREAPPESSGRSASGRCRMSWLVSAVRFLFSYACEYRRNGSEASLFFS